MKQVLEFIRQKHLFIEKLKMRKPELNSHECIELMHLTLATIGQMIEEAEMERVYVPEEQEG